MTEPDNAFDMHIDLALRTIRRRPSLRCNEEQGQVRLWSNPSAFEFSQTSILKVDEILCMGVCCNNA